MCSSGGRSGFRTAPPSELTPAAFAKAEWVHLILGNVRTGEGIGAQDALPPKAREAFYPRIAIRACTGAGKLCGNTPRRPPRRPGGHFGALRAAPRMLAHSLRRKGSIHA